MNRDHEHIDKAAKSGLSVLITGPSGAGKSRLAREIHDRSPRASGPFTVLDCGAVPEDLIESTLFGHVEGAFTGADRARQGIFERADGGTLLLEQVSEMPAGLQVRMLRVLQEGKVSPLGSFEERNVDVRIVATTSQPLRELVDAGRFRADLFYRLSVLPIELGGLDERRDELPSLAAALLERAAEEFNTAPPLLSAKAIDTLQAQRWPGNLRQLDNVLRRALALGGTKGFEDTLLAELRTTEEQPQPEHVAQDSFIYGDTIAVRSDVLSYREASTELEQLMIDRALAKSAGNRDAAARLLGMSRRSLFYKLKARGES